MANLTQIVYLTREDYEALLADTHDPKQYTKNGKTIYYDENALYITPETVTMEDLSGTLPVSKGGTGASSFTTGQLLVGNGTNAISTKAISSSIINNANTIPTTQAVYNDALLKSGGTMTGNILGNGTATLGSSAHPFHQLVLGGATNANLAADSTNPRITFQESNGTQPVHLIYSDYDNYRSPAGLKIIGGTSASPAWLEVEGNVYAAAFKGNADTATAFSANKEVKLTGDVTGSASSTGGWSIATTIGKDKVTNAMLAGSIANEKLANSSVKIGNKTISLGETATLADIGVSYPVTSVAGNTGTITADTLRTSLGLSNAMHFLGVTTTNISTGTANTTATVTIGSSNVTAAAGDVVLYGSQEYVWGNSKWNLLGDESSYKVKQTAVNDPTAATTTSTTFIDTISQDANGVITATKKTLPTASTTVAGITKVGASGGAAAYSHTHSYLANTNTGAADRPIYITGNAPAQTTYRMSGTNTTATAAIAITTDLPTGNWYVNGTAGIYNQSDGVVYAEQYNSSWIHEIYGDYRTGQIAVRGKNNGTWQAWRKVLDSSNWKTLIGATTAAASATKYLREDGSWQVPVDTKNTAGSTNSESKLYLIGATTQAANPTTNSYKYTYTNNGLLSAIKLGLNLNGTEKAHMEWNDTDQSIDFVFN
jgi:hypothetical protein